MAINYKPSDQMSIFKSDPYIYLLIEKKTFLAYRVNGEVLPQKHGFPLRLVYEDAYGYDWVKYVEEIVIS